MDFEIRNIRVKFLGWDLEFRMLKAEAYQKFYMRNAEVPKEAYVQKKNEKGEMETGIDMTKVPKSYFADFSELDEKFLIENIVSAKKGDQELKGYDLEVLVSHLLQDDEFNEWKEGYFNGPKKT